MESEAGVPIRHTRLMLPRLYSFPWVTAGLSEGVMSSLCPMLYAQTPPWHQQMTTVSPPCARPFGGRAPWGALALAPSLTLFSSTCIVLSHTLAPGLASAQSVSVLWSLGRQPLKFRFMSDQLSVLCASLVPVSFQTLCVFVECN